MRKACPTLRWVGGWGGAAVDRGRGKKTRGSTPGRRVGLRGNGRVACSAPRPPRNGSLRLTFSRQQSGVHTQPCLQRRATGVSLLVDCAVRRNRQGAAGWDDVFSCAGFEGAPSVEHAAVAALQKELKELSSAKVGRETGKGVECVRGARIVRVALSSCWQTAELFAEFEARANFEAPQPAGGALGVHAPLEAPREGRTSGRTTKAVGLLAGPIAHSPSGAQPHPKQAALMRERPPAEEATPAGFGGTALSELECENWRSPLARRDSNGSANTPVAEAEGTAVCDYCGQAMPQQVPMQGAPRRQARHCFCSHECYEAFSVQVRCRGRGRSFCRKRRGGMADGQRCCHRPLQTGSGGAVRRRLAELESGICQLCGLDCHALFMRLCALDGVRARIQALAATNFVRLDLRRWVQNPRVMEDAGAEGIDRRAAPRHAGWKNWRKSPSRACSGRRITLSLSPRVAARLSWITTAPCACPATSRRPRTLSMPVRRHCRWWGFALGTPSRAWARVCLAIGKQQRQLRAAAEGSRDIRSFFSLPRTATPPGTESPSA